MLFDSFLKENHIFVMGEFFRLSMKVLQFIGGIVFLFIFASCAHNAEIYNSGLPDGSVGMSYKVQKKVTDKLLLEVINFEDTRCPVGEVCSNPGYVDVEIRASSGIDITSTTLRYNDFQPCDLSRDTIFNYVVELVKVTPFHYADKPAQNAEIYRFAVVVEEL